MVFWSGPLYKDHDDVVLLFLLCFALSSVQAEDMIAEIKKAFIGNLPHVKWMDEETKAQALKKVRRASQYCHNIIF